MLFNLSISTYHRSEWKINLQFAVSKVIYGRTGFVTCVKGLEAMYLLGFYLSGRRDLNSRPPAPKVKPNINTTSKNIKPTSKHMGFQYLQLMVSTRCFRSSTVPKLSRNRTRKPKRDYVFWLSLGGYKVTFLSCLLHIYGCQRCQRLRINRVYQRFARLTKQRDKGLLIGRDGTIEGASATSTISINQAM